MLILSEEERTSVIEILKSFVVFTHQLVIILIHTIPYQVASVLITTITSVDIVAIISFVGSILGLRSSLEHISSRENLHEVSTLMKVKSQVHISLVTISHRPHESYLVEAHLRLLTINVSSRIIKREVCIG